MINYFRKIAFINPADTDEMVILTNIVEGQEGSTSIIVTSEEADPLKIDAGDTILGKERFTINLQVLRDSTALAQLIAWRDAQTPLLMSALGLDGVITMRLSSSNYVKLVANETFDNTVSIGLKVTRDAVFGYNATTFERNVGFQIGENMLGLWKVDEGNGTRLYGFTGSVNLTESTSGAVATSTRLTDASTTRQTSSRYFFPFAGEVVKWVVNFTTVSGTNQASVQIRTIDKTEAQIALYTTALPIGTTGVQTAQVTLDASTVYISVDLRPGTVTGDSIVYSQPQLKLATASNTFTLS